MGDTKKKAFQGDTSTPNNEKDKKTTGVINQAVE
jgi:hypothetical protein